MARSPDPDAWLDAFDPAELADPELARIDEAVERLAGARPPARTPTRRLGSIGLLPTGLGPKGLGVGAAVLAALAATALVVSRLHPTAGDPEAAEPARAVDGVEAARAADAVDGADRADRADGVDGVDGVEVADGAGVRALLPAPLRFGVGPAEDFEPGLELAPGRDARVGSASRTDSAGAGSVVHRSATEGSAAAEGLAAEGLAAEGLAAARARAARPAPGLLPGQGARITVDGGVASLSEGLLTYVHDRDHEPGVRAVALAPLPVTLRPVGTAFSADVRPFVGAVRVTDGTVQVVHDDGTLLGELRAGQEAVGVTDLNSPAEVRLVHTTGLPLDALPAQLPSDCLCHPRDVIAAVAAVRFATRPTSPTTAKEAP